MDSKYSKFIFCVFLLLTVPTNSQSEDSNRNNVHNTVNSHEVRAKSNCHEVEEIAAVEEKTTPKTVSVNYYETIQAPLIVNKHTTSDDTNSNIETKKATEVNNTEVKFRKASHEITKPIPLQKPQAEVRTHTDDPIVCVERSKLMSLGDGFFLQNRRQLNHKNPIEGSVRNANPDHDLTSDIEFRKLNDEREFSPIDNGLIDLSQKPIGYGNSVLKCYACSNVSNAYCNEPSSLTTIKFCQDSLACLSKVVNADGTPVLIRDCGETCDKMYNENFEECSICYSELCNGANTFTSYTMAINTFCTVVILFLTKNL